MIFSGSSLDQSFQLGDILKKGLELKATETALELEQGDETYTFHDLDHLSSKLAAGLCELGVKPGDRVASFMPNGAELTLLYLACIKANFVMTPLNYRYTPSEIDYALSLTQASLLVAHANREDDIRDCEKVQHLPYGLVMAGESSHPFSWNNPIKFETLIHTTITTCAPVDDQEEPIEINQDDSPAFIFLTSGSTGKPKGVTHSRKTFGGCLATMNSVFGLNTNDIVFPGSSISHVAGTLYTLCGLGVGAKVAMTSNYENPHKVLQLFRKTRPSIACMLPNNLFKLVQCPQATKSDFSSIRLFHSGGDKVQATLQQEYNELTGSHICELYGMSEGGIMTGHYHTDVVGPEKTLGSIGRACPGYELTVRDSDKREVAAGELGRLWVRSSAVMVGYWNNPNATRDTIQCGWLDTGDVVKIDQDGYVWFCGREKHLIIHDGSNISPIEIEEVLLQHDAVSNAAVVGIPDPVHGEIVCAFVTITNAHEEHNNGCSRPSAQDLIQYAKSQVGYKAPEVIHFLPTLPLNPTGKTDRHALKQVAMQQLAQ